MMDTITVQMNQQGVLVLPKALCDKYDLQPGDNFSLQDLGGVFIISTWYSKIDALADGISQNLQDQGETLDGMLQLLREEREADQR